MRKQKASKTAPAASDKPSAEQLKRRFVSLADEVRLPTLDRLLFRNNVLRDPAADPRTLASLVASLEEHRVRTSRVVDAIHAREEIFTRLCSYVDRFGAGVPPLDVQTKVLRLLCLLQRRTQAVVEAVAHWRKTLTRPFGFHYEGHNYLLRIARDSVALQESSISKVLPLQTATYPLCSNVPALALFACTATAVASQQDGCVVPLSCTTATVPPQQLRRLKRCERLVATEFETQLSLYQELVALCVRGEFLPMLSTPVVPGADTGIAINSKKWAVKQASLLQKCYDALTSAPPLARGML